MGIQRMDNVAIVVKDLDGAVDLFTELGMELEGRTPIEGLCADQTVGIAGIRSEIAMMRTPDGHGRVELTTYHSPDVITPDPLAPAPNTVGGASHHVRGRRHRRHHFPAIHPRCRTSG